MAKKFRISLFVLAHLTNVTDRQTDGRTPGDSKDRAYASHRAVKIGVDVQLWSVHNKQIRQLSVWTLTCATANSPTGCAH